MTLEEVNNLKREISTLKAGGIGFLDQIDSLNKQLHLEKERAYKAEEMVYLLTKNLTLNCIIPQLDETSEALRKILPIVKAFSNSYLQTLCDEIERIIRTKISEYPSNHVEGAYNSGLEDSIEIARSILVKSD